MSLNIALGFDKNFAKYAAVTIASVIANSKTPVKFFLMHDNLPQNILRPITKMIEMGGYCVEWFNMTDDYGDMFVGGWSRAMYYPISLSKICDENRILFLDADTIVTGDLSEFYNQDLSETYVAAAHDYGMFSTGYSKNLYKISENKRVTIREYFKDYIKWEQEDLNKYFNSGLLLCNLEEMRKDNVHERMIAILNTRELVFPDQDCFNIACHEKVKIVSHKNNYMVIEPRLWEGINQSVIPEIQKYKDEKETPLVIHYIFKPWKEFEGYKVEFGELFWEYKSQTPWKSRYDKKFFKSLRRNLVQFRLSKTESYLRVLGTTVFEYK